MWSFVYVTSIFLGVVTGTYSSQECSASQSAFDFIIVGGGTAGVVLGTRLSQNLPEKCILIIEAGPDGRSEQKIYVPGLRGSTLGGALDWVLPTVPMPGASNRTIIHNRGRVLGGSSALNLMAWDRATVAEYDAWEDLGNPGWNFDSMYPAMLRVENFQRKDGPAQYGTDGIGYGGPVQIGLIEKPPPHVSSGIPTLNNLGINGNLDSLNGTSIGVMYQPAMQRFSNHTRSYSVDYLPGAGPNLILRFNTTVHKVLLDDDACTTGVVLEDGTQIAARKEVIISAGSLLSPKILELSGIGQESILSAANVTQKVDLPGVGENLQDHLRIQTTYQLKPSILGLDILRYNSTLAAIELAKWHANQTSLYQYAGSCYGFLKWKHMLCNETDLLNLATQSADPSNPVDMKKLSLLTNASSGVPDVEVVFSDGYFGIHGYPANGTAGYGKQFTTLIAGIMHPFARGYVHINSSDPTTKPIINPNFLSTPYDVEATKQAAIYTRKMSQTAPFSDVWVQEFDPGQAVQTDSQWEEYIRNNVYTFYHPLGTCAMLPQKDGGVVDAELRVYGVRGLRVVDASVIPMMISAHLQTAVYGIAERAAEMIAKSWS